MKHENFGKNLRQVLGALGMTQAEFARRSGLSESLVSNYLNGHREPSVSTLCKILKVVPTTFERLVAESVTQGS